MSAILSQSAIEAIRRDFPILETSVDGKPLVYLDNAATTQKPLQVINALNDYYRASNANIHRGVHHLSQVSTRAYENARHRVQKFLNAKEDSEIVFARGTTEGINLIASCYGGHGLKQGDEVLISEMEHHSNIVPWQMICEKTGAELKVTRIDDNGQLDMDDFEKKLTANTRIVSIVHISNAIGTVNPIQSIIEKAHQQGAIAVIDGAQAAPHLAIDVQKLNCDFYLFSGHKVYGPTGIGVLYGKRALLEEMPPYQGGGDMIKQVRFEGTTYNDPPFRFEAGTPHIAGAIGLSAALDYLDEIGLERIYAYEQDLLSYGLSTLAEVEGLKFIGEAPERSGVISFIVNEIHPHDIGTLLDHEGIAVRTGHHCTQPLMKRLNVTATIRASLGIYTTRDEIDLLAEALQKVIRFF